MHSNILALFAGLSTLAAAVPTALSKEPCAHISHLYERQRENSRHAPYSEFTFPGELVHECMRSIPFDSKRGVAFVEELRKYLQFHSTTEVLKNPPSGYQSPPIDLFGTLDRIGQLAADNKYTSQEDFDNDIYYLFNFAYDGHLAVSGLCTQTLFSYRNSMPVVSISTDGLELPKIYAAEDVPFLKSNSHRVSPLVSVDGQDAVSFFREQGAKQSLQDPDARYNSVFKTYNRGGPENAILSGGIWQYPEVWPGQSSYAFKFENGTVRNIATEAILHKKHEQSGFNFPNGKAIFRKICASESKASSLAAPSSSETPGASSSALFRTSATPTPSSSPSASSRASLPATIPTPVMKDPYNNVLGFYLKEKGLQDVAVLLVSTFSAELDGITSFVDSVSKFLGQAVDDGKTRLVIDVTGNSGGVINLAYDLFKQLFPSKPIYGAGRFRNHEAMDFLGRAFEHITAPDDISGIGNLGIQGAATPNQTYHFKSWQELNGPHEELGVNVSSLSAKDFSRVASDKVPIHGYGSYKFNQTISPFKPENIVLVTDGFCASACTILAENLKWQGVKNVVFGGRPQREQMQAIGGVKGYQVANSLNFAHFLDVFSRMQDNSVRKGKPIFTNEEMKRFNAIAPGIDSPPLPLGNIQVNMFNQYAPGDDDMPLHFVYEPADCRLFYTLDNIYNAATIWSTAAHTYWNNGPCVHRSTKAKLSASSSVSFSLSIPSATPTKSTSSSRLNRLE